MLKKILIIAKYFIALLILTIFFHYAFSTRTQAEEVFSDDFESGHYKWEFSGTSNSKWSIKDGEFGGIVYTGVTNAVPKDDYWDNSLQNYEYQVDLKGVQGTDRNLVFKFKDNKNFYSLHHTGEHLYFAKYIDNHEYRFANPRYYPLLDGVTYHFIIRVEGNHLQVFEKDLGNLLFDVTDSSGPKILGGKIGLRIGVGSVAPAEVWYDNVVVTKISPLPSLSVPDLKQYDDQWADQVYDRADNWAPNDPTIGRWGCTLTSASMILMFYGHSTSTPNVLNDWLNSQSDGFIRNGLINWLAISRYSKINDSPTSPTLLYKQMAPTKENLVAQLEAGGPAILTEDGHYVVAKSQLNSSFGINDPSSSYNTTLEAYGNTFFGLIAFEPTHTDLSSILLVVNANITMRVLGENGKEISDHSFFERPIKSDVEPYSLSGDSVNIFLLPTPSEKEYTIVLEGNGEYELDSYLYDIDANVTVTTFQDVVHTGQPNTYRIYYGDKTVFKEVTLTSIMNDLDVAFNSGLFRNNGIYNAIKRLLATALKMFQRNTTLNS